MTRLLFRVILLLSLCFLAIQALDIDKAAAQNRIKDIAKFAGLESKRIKGYGLVTGLQGTGDGTQITPTIQAVANFYTRMGITVDATRLRQRNIAGVAIYAEIPPFSKRGTKVDVIISTMGDAQSLEGGVLMQAPLTDLSDNWVGFAEGPISVGGLNNLGGTQNFTASGRVINGAQLEVSLDQTYQTDGNIQLNLNNPDFTTAFRIAQVVNEAFGENTAAALDPATVNIKIEGEFKNDRQIEFLSLIEQLTVDIDLPAKIIINEKTGTIIAGNDVKISPVMITHGTLTIAIRPPEGAPADALAQAGAVVVLDARTGSSIQDLASALNALQVTPNDLIAIFQALKAQGALKAELVII